MTQHGTIRVMSFTASARERGEYVALEMRCVRGVQSRSVTASERLAAEQFEGHEDDFEHVDMETQRSEGELVWWRAPRLRLCFFLFVLRGSNFDLSLSYSVTFELSMFQAT